MKSFEKQIGGDHYKQFAIQPTEFIMRNKLSFLQGCIVKRICRYNLKGNAKQDLEKIKHEVDMIMDLEGLKEKPKPFVNLALLYDGHTPECKFRLMEGFQKCICDHDKK